MTDAVSAVPAQARDPWLLDMRAKAQLRQAVWEATQFMSYDEVRTFVDGVLREVERDEP